MTTPRFLVLYVLAALLSLWPYALDAQAPAPDTPVTVTSIPLAEATSPCSGAFVTHDLPHTTAVAGDLVQMFDANGAGVAAGDLDGDGDLDLFLGNHDGPDTLLWNMGGLNFRKEEWPGGKTRAVSIVDVTGDGHPDIVLTRNTGAFNYFENQADGRFQRRTLPGVAAPAYALNWGDLDRDGDLDLVTGTYDAGLLTDRGNEYLVGNATKGVFFYANRDGRFAPLALASEAQALAILLADLDVDGWLDIMVGNDFWVPEMIWLRRGDGWAPAEPFAFTSHSTMSLDQGDVDGDGTPEIFTADMRPYPGEDMADWAPVMDDMMEGVTRELVTAERQLMSNMLQQAVAPGEYLDLASDWGVDGTGWSWSSKFGDLDNDGRLDLYSVNGMIEERLFAHMPNHELVEENQAFRNEDGLRFRRMPGWKLNSTYSGRGMVMADLDADGDLDIVVNNLRGPAQLFENQLCGGSGLVVDLRWPSSANPFAIGAQAVLHTSVGPLLRDVRAGSGYLSGDPAQLHFGLPADATIDRLEIHWPDGATSTVDDLEGQTHVMVTRS